MDYFPSSTAGVGGLGRNGEDGLAIQAVHSAGLTRLIHAPQPQDREGAVDRLFTAGDDYLVRILPSQIDSSVEPLIIDDATKAVTWIDADADYLVTGSEDGCVRIYQHSQPMSEMESQMTSPTDLICLLARASLAIRSVVLERAVAPGKTPRVAICSDELVVKVVDAGDPKRVQLLTGHARGLRAASWNPMQPQLATCSADGSVKIWDLSTTEPECVKTLDSILAVSSSQSEQSSEVVWHPSGTFFVVPSKTHELVAINAQTYQRMGSFVVGHDSHVAVPTGEVTSFAFSPNGRFLASATTDGRLTVWDSSTRAAIRSVERSSVKTGISWHPTKDALAWTDTVGQLTRWSDVVGPKYASPCEHVEYLPESQARQKKQRDEIDDLFSGTGLDEDELDVEQQQQVVPVRKPTIRRDRDVASSSWTGASKSQAVFQPTSTPMRNGRRFLCLNMVGSLTAIEHDSHQSISFESHDANARRNWRFVDHFGYTMAAIGATGALLACPGREGQGGEEFDEEDEGEDEAEVARRKGRPSSIHFRPFEALGAWSASGSEWSLNLAKGEDVVAVAMGGCKAKGGVGSTGVDNVTAIVATSTGYLRFFSASGMQRYIWALGSQVVSMAAGNRSLLVVHRSSAASDQYQNLSYTLIDLLTFAVKQEGALPLAKGVTLTWLGFNEMDVAAIFDSRQVLCILDRSLGPVGQARWVPALDVSLTGIEGSTGGEHSHVKVWPVGLETNNLMTVFLKRGSLAYPDPSSSSYPLIQEVTLKMPLLNLDTPMGGLEEQHMRLVQLASLLRSYQGSSSLADGNEEADEAVRQLSTPSTLEHESDKALLQLVQLACKSDKHQKVLDAAKELHSGRTLDAALQIGAFFHLSSLVDRMGAYREWVSTRRERDERMVWSGDVGAAMVGNGREVDSRVLVSQTPSLLDTEDVQARRTATAALGTDFSPARKRKSYGEGKRSDLAKVGHSPSSTWASGSGAAASMEPNRQSDKENESQDMIHGQKRRASEEANDDNDDDEAAQRRAYAIKSSKAVSSSKNPFARTAGMTRDRSMHKSSSFFDRVDASMAGGTASKPALTTQKINGKVKQATLFGMAKGGPAAKPSASPAFAGDENEDEESAAAAAAEEEESNIRLTLGAAARKDDESQRLEETLEQPNDGQESQYDSMAIDVGA